MRVLNFNKVTEWTYQTEGWGITHNTKNLIMSDGTNSLYFIDPKTFKIVRTLKVKTSEGNPVRYLNELEYINSHIYANLWYSRDIAVINPKTGIVIQFLDCSTLPQIDNYDAVLNGIAYNNETGEFYLTGKLWNKLYKVKLEEIASP